MDWAPPRDIAARRPVFHAEADFQQELAWQLRLAKWTHVRLEHPFRLDGAINLDIFGRNGGDSVAIELKYWKLVAKFVLGDEAYDLKANAAHDLCRYDFWKDVVRLETRVAAGVVQRGLAIALTTDTNHWKKSTRNTIDENFRIHEGGVVEPRTLRWAERAGAGTTKGREKPLKIKGRYELGWALFSDHPEVGQSVWALVVEVGG